MAEYPATVPLKVMRNADYAETWVVAENFDSNGDAIDPQDLTGWSAILQVRLYGLAAGAALISLATVTTPIQGIQFTEPTAGQFVVRIDKSALEALPASGKAGAAIRFVYDIVMTDLAGLKCVYAEGEFAVSPGVAR